MTATENVLGERMCLPCWQGVGTASPKNILMDAHLLPPWTRLFQSHLYFTDFTIISPRGQGDQLSCEAPSGRHCPALGRASWAIIQVPNVNTCRGVSHPFVYCSPLTPSGCKRTSRWSTDMFNRNILTFKHLGRTPFPFAKANDHLLKNSLGLKNGGFLIQDRCLWLLSRRLTLVDKSIQQYPFI